MSAQNFQCHEEKIIKTGCANAGGAKIQLGDNVTRDYGAVVSITKFTFRPRRIVSRVILLRVLHLVDTRNREGNAKTDFTRYQLRKRKVKWVWTEMSVLLYMTCVVTIPSEPIRSMSSISGNGRCSFMSALCCTERCKKVVYVAGAATALSSPGKITAFISTEYQSRNFYACDIERPPRNVISNAAL